LVSAPKFIRLSHPRQSAFIRGKSGLGCLLFPINTTPTQRPAVPRAEHQHRLDPWRSPCEARGIGSAALKGYQSRRPHTRIETNRVNLEAPRRSSGMFQNPTSQRSRSLTARLTRLAIGIRDSMSRGIEFRLGRRYERDKARPESPCLLPLTNYLCRQQRQHNDMLFREPNSNAA
jgi:hypothetical protein